MDIFGQLPVSARKIAKEIKKEVRRLAKDKRPDWNRKIKEVLGELGKKKDYNVYPDPEKKDGAWLLDMIWMDKNTGAIHLAVESELGDEKEVLDDFQKLLCIKAPLKIMIYYVHKEPFVKQFENYLRDFDQHVKGEHYLLIEFAPGPTGPLDHAYLYAVPHHGRLAKVRFEDMILGPH